MPGIRLLFGAVEVGLTAILYAHSLVTFVGLGASTNTFLPLIGSGSDSSTAIADVQFVMPIAGTFKNLRINKTVSSLQGNLSINIGGSNGNLNATLVGTGESTDLVDTDVVAAGELVTFVVGTNTAGNVTLSRITVEFHEL